MLSKLLNKEQCARCKICCGFNSSDIWETPIISNDLKKEISEKHLPEQEFLNCKTHYLFKMNKEPDKDLYFCPALDHTKGCSIGNEKPFDCQIWPFRVMKLGDKRVITLSPVCPEVQKKPLCDIVETAEKISAKIFDYADKNPFAVKDYIEGYPIIIVEK